MTSIRVILIIKGDSHGNLFRYSLSLSYDSFSYTSFKILLGLFVKSLFILSAHIFSTSYLFKQIV